MHPDMIITIVGSAVASSGFWALLTHIIDTRQKKQSADTKLLIGLAHDRICSLAEMYIGRGWISKDEYENLNDYLYIPYRERGGNGTAKKLMDEVNKLPIRERNYSPVEA